MVLKKDMVLSLKYFNLANIRTLRKFPSWEATDPKLGSRPSILLETEWDR